MKTLHSPITNQVEQSSDSVSSPAIITRCLNYLLEHIGSSYQCKKCGKEAISAIYLADYAHQPQAQSERLLYLCVNCNNSNQKLEEIAKKVPNSLN